MQTLSKGYKKPQSPDTGDLVFPALEADIQQMNDHAHNGTDSQPLATRQQTVVHAAWVAQGGGTYRQTITVPTGLSYDTCDIWVQRSTGERVYATMVRISTTQFYLYTNDSTVDYTLSYR